MEINAQSLLRQADHMFSTMERVNVESQWAELAEFLLPNNTGSWHQDETRGDKKTRRVFDSVGPQANHDLASAMHSTLTNPATNWVKFRFDSMQLNNDNEALEWLDICADVFMSTLNESNFNTEVSKGYKNLTALGTMVLYHEDDRDDKGNWIGFRFKVWHLGDVAWSENHKGRVDTIARRFKLTARQAKEKWGDKCDDRIKQAYEQRPEDEFEFVHIIMPRKHAKGDSMKKTKGKDRPFASYYVCKTGNQIMEEDGYYDFPVFVCRWETGPNEVYGRGPGHISISDVRSLNKVKELSLRSMAKSIDPPMLVNHLSIVGNFDLRPGHVSVVRDINGVREMVPQARYDVTQFSVEQLHSSIKQSFFIDKLMLPDREKIGEMSALEVSQRVQQMQRVLGPTLGRVDAELLNPLVIRGFQMLMREGAFPPPPESIAESGAGVKVEYLNAMSRSQKVEELQAIQQWVQQLAGMAQLGRPEALDLVNVDVAGYLLARIQGVPESVIANDKDVQTMRKQRAEQQQQQMMLQQAMVAADASSKMAKAGGGQQ